jgi:hypothetical protein
MACDTPYYVEVKWRPEKIPVPCGKCPPCQTRRVSQWSFRLRKQEEISKTSLFITLTYDTRHVPISPKGFMTLKKRDFQLFMKSLRKYHETRNQNEKISYYAAAEYGSNNYRPHFHAIVFNTSEEAVAECWKLGTVHCGKVTGASIAYTLKYINKGKLIPAHANDDRVPEFSLMSKGIGAHWLTPQIIRKYKNDLRVAYITIDGGIKIAMPRYYKNKIYTEHEQQTQAAYVKAVLEENDQRARRIYRSTHGSEAGYEDEIESGKRSRYRRHRKQGKENRKL